MQTAFHAPEHVPAPANRGMAMASLMGPFNTRGQQVLAGEDARATTVPSCCSAGVPARDSGPFRARDGSGDDQLFDFFRRLVSQPPPPMNTLLEGPVEFDDGDLYRDLDAVLTALRAGTAQVFRNGVVVVNGDSQSPLFAQVGP